MADVAELERELNQRIEKIQKMASTNAPYGGKVNAEKLYALSYQALVRANLRPQIRGKYRGN